MLEAVKINTKLHTVSEVSSVSVGLDRLWGEKKPNSITVSGIILPTIPFLTM